MPEDSSSEQLSRWLREVQLEPGGARQAAIEEASTLLAKSLAGGDVLDMVLLAHGHERGTAFGQLSNAIRGSDETFGGRPDDLDSKIAACATVAAVLAGNSKSASIASQGVRSAQWLGLAPAVSDLPDLGHSSAARRSEALRGRRTKWPAIGDDEFKGVPKFDAEGQEGQPATQQDLRKLRDASAGATRALRMGQQSLLRALSARLAAADEELDLLWWAFTGYSELAHKPWAEVMPEAAPVLCGIEFAQKLRFELEIPSTEALLARMLGGGSDDTIELATSVESAGRLVASTALPDGHPLLPVLSSISEFRALDGDESWKGSVGRWEIVPTHNTTRLALALQCARECVLSENL